MAQKKQDRRIRLKKHIRQRVSGTSERPRLSVFRSNKQFYAQFIDDVSGKTLCAVSTKDKDFIEKDVRNKIEMAKQVGKMAAAKSKEAGISEVIFDRSGYLYHGRVKAFAEAAREGGLKF